MSQDWAAPFFIDPFILPGMKADFSARKPAVRSATPATRAKATAEKAPRSTRASKPVARQNPPEVLPVDDDQTLLEFLHGIGEHDQAALSRFYDLTVGRVYSIALRIVRHADMAEEVVSDVYMQVWRDAHRYDETRGRVLGWLLVIARSRALDFLRRQDEAFSHPDPYDLVTEPESTRQNPQDLLEATQEGSAVHAAMQKLNPLQRQLLSLAFFRGLTHSEIVEHSGIPLGSVKTHIRRALAILRETLDPDGVADAGETS